MADQAIYQLDELASLNAADRLPVQQTSAATTTKSATVAQLGGLVTVAAGNSSVTGLVGVYHNWDTENLSADRTWTLPTAANVDQRCGFYLAGDCNGFWVKVVSGASGDFIGGLDCSSIPYRRLNRQGAYFIFRCVDGTPGAMRWIVDSRWQGTGFADDPPDGLRPVFADDVTDDAPATQALLDAQIGEVILPAGDVVWKGEVVMGNSGDNWAGAGILRGQGACTEGEAVDFSGTVVKYAGPPGEPMLTINGSRGRVSDLMLLGHINDNWATETTAQIQAGGDLTTTIKIAAGSADAHDWYNGMMFNVVSGTGSGQSERVADYNKDTLIITLAAALATPLSASDSMYTFTYRPLAAINVQRRGTTGLSTGRHIVTNVNCRNHERAFYINDYEERTSNKNEAGGAATVSQASSSTITISSGVFPNYPETANRLSGNPFTTPTLVVAGNTYTILSGINTPTVTVAETVPSFSNESFYIRHWKEFQNAHNTLQHCEFRDCIDCFVCDNTQSYENSLLNCSVHGTSGRTANFVNVQGGGNVLVTGGNTTEAGMTVLRLGTGTTSSATTMTVINFTFDAQADPITWLYDVANSRVRTHFLNCACPAATTQLLTATRTGSARTPEIIFDNCLVRPSGLWTLTGNTSHAVMLTARNAEIGIPSQRGNVELGSTLGTGSGVSTNFVLNIEGPAASDAHNQDEQTLITGVATPQVRFGNRFYCEGSTTITDFLIHAVSGEGKRIQVRGNGLVTIDGTGNIKLRGGATSITPSATEIYEFERRATSWIEL